MFVLINYQIQVFYSFISIISMAFPSWAERLFILLSCFPVLIACLSFSVGVMLVLNFDFFSNNISFRISYSVETFEGELLAEFSIEKKIIQFWDMFRGYGKIKAFRKNECFGRKIHSSFINEISVGLFEINFFL